jgi:hypothetical protein
MTIEIEFTLVNFGADMTTVQSIETECAKQVKMRVLSKFFVLFSIIFLI